MIIFLVVLGENVACLPFTGGNRLVHGNDKQNWQMGNSFRDWRVPFVQFTLIYSASVERFTIGARPGTGRKKVNGTQFSVRILWLGSLNYFSRCSVYFGNFPTGQTKIALPFTVQQKFLAVFWKW